MVMEQLCEVIKTNTINNPKPPLCFANKKVRVFKVYEIEW